MLDQIGNFASTIFDILKGALDGELKFSLSAMVLFYSPSFLLFVSIYIFSAAFQNRQERLKLKELVGCILGTFFLALIYGLIQGYSAISHITLGISLTGLLGIFLFPNNDFVKVYLARIISRVDPNMEKNIEVKAIKAVGNLPDDLGDVESGDS